MKCHYSSSTNGQFQMLHACIELTVLAHKMADGEIGKRGEIKKKTGRNEQDEFC